MAIEEKEVAQIKGMLARGDRHMDVGTYFGVNQARISEIKLGKGWGKKYRHVRPEYSDLPPKGPYVVVSKATFDDLEVKARANQEVIRVLENLIERVKTGV